MTLAFDTLKFADRLEAGGFTGEQAKTAEAALSDTFSESVATKADLDQAVERLTHTIDNLRTHVDRSIERLDVKIERLDTKIDASELRLTVKMGAMMVVLAGVIGALLKIMH